MSRKDSLWQGFRNAKTPHNQQEPIIRSSQGIGCSGTGLRYAAPSLLACLLACAHVVRASKQNAAHFEGRRPIRQRRETKMCLVVIHYLQGAFSLSHGFL